MNYHVMTGEYPPTPGGVADYSRLLAAALAREGESVHVWTGPAVGETPDEPGVTVHRDAGRWSPADLARLGDALDAFPTPHRLIVEYVPNAWGYQGLNFRFCRWLVRRRERGDDIRVMFHEVAYPFVPFGKPTRWLLAAGHRLMARDLLKAATHVDVAIPAWGTLLRACRPGDRRPFALRPVPSNVPVIDDPEGVVAARRRIAPNGGVIVGSFGSFADNIGALLAALLPELLHAHPDRAAVLIGRKGEPLAARLIAAHPELDGRIKATGGLSPAEASTYLQACDVLVQPYPDGVSGRRGSVMAGLAHGVAVVTNAGRLTEAYWAESGSVELAPTPATGATLAAAERLLADPAQRAQVGAAGRDLHTQRFAIERTVEAILGASAQVAS